MFDYRITKCSQVFLAVGISMASFVTSVVFILFSQSKTKLSQSNVDWRCKIYMKARVKPHINMDCHSKKTKCLLQIFPNIAVLKVKKIYFI